MKRLKEEKKSYTFNDRCSSGDTLVCDLTTKSMEKRKSKKEKTARRSKLQGTVKPDDKLSKTIARILSSELASDAVHGGLSEVLEKPVEHQHSTIIPQRSPFINAARSSTVTIRQTCAKRESTLRNWCSFHFAGIVKATYQRTGIVFPLDDMAALAAVQRLVNRFGNVSHMAVLDKTYNFFLTTSQDGALCFKLHDRVAVVGGDPLCEQHNIPNTLAEFAVYRRKYNWEVIFLGATPEFTNYAQSKNWITIQFGIERVLNPVTNSLVAESGAGKRTISTSKQLLKKKNVSLSIYIPRNGPNPAVEEELAGIYAHWCSTRNNTSTIQAYVSVLDSSAMPELMVYIFTRDARGKVCGFAALRKIVNGYHLDPCIAAPGAPRGVSELLILSAMSLLHETGTSYLSLGFEPSPELGPFTGISPLAQSLMRSIYGRLYKRLPIGGKRAFYDKFHPDEAQQRGLFIVVPTQRLPRLRQIKAIMHTANIDISRLILETWKARQWVNADTDTKEKTKNGSEAKPHNPTTSQKLVS